MDKYLTKMMNYFYSNYNEIVSSNYHIYLCCVVVNGRKCVIKSNNYLRKCIDSHECRTMHAEVNTIRDYLKKGSVKNIKRIYIVHPRRDGSLKDCLVCGDCAEYIKKNTYIDKVYCFGRDRKCSVQTL